MKRARGLTRTLKLLSVCVAIMVAIAGLALAGSPSLRHSAKNAYSAMKEGRLANRLREKLDEWTIRAQEAWNPPEADAAYWTIESAAERSALPEFMTIPAARPEELVSAAAPSPFASNWWPRSHGDSGSTRFSSLTQIDRSNVARLVPVWTFHAGVAANIQSNPVVVDGLVFSAAGETDVVAFTAAGGEEVWRYRSSAPFPAKRGLVWWPGDDEHAPRVYFPAGNRLVALDAKTGSQVSSFGTNGVVATRAEGKIAPAIAGRVLVHATVDPAVHGLDVVTGDLLWSVSLVDEDPPPRAGGHASKDSGGRPWGGMALDEGRGIAYVTTSNPSPVLVGVDRPGNNPFSVSVVAIDVDNGKVLWSFQEIAHDLWDLDIPASPVLTSIVRAGRRVDVVATVTKFGNTLLLDRVSGKPVFDFRLRRAPTSSVPGERTAPYQPAVELPQPFARQVFDGSEVTTIGAENAAYVRDQISTRNFGFFVPHEVGVETVFYGLHGGAEWPGAAGDPRSGVLYIAGNNVPSMATIVGLGARLEPEGLQGGGGRSIYVRHCMQCHGSSREGKVGPSLRQMHLRSTPDAVRSVVRNGQQAMPPISALTVAELDLLLEYLFAVDTDAKTTQGAQHSYERTAYRRLLDQEGYPGSAPPWGTMTAIDLNTGQIKWQVPLGEYPELSSRGIPKTGMENFGGPIVTASGLVFVAGTKDRRIRAFDAASGEELWSHELPFVGSAPPTTYEVEGRQFLLVPATGGGTLRTYDESVGLGDAFVAFALAPDPTGEPRN